MTAASRPMKLTPANINRLLKAARLHPYINEGLRAVTIGDQVCVRWERPMGGGHKSAEVRAHYVEQATEALADRGFTLVEDASFSRFYVTDTTP